MRQRALKNSKAQAILEARARAMRHAPTASEERLFRALRGNALGVRFVRQVPIGGYIVDLLAPSARLVVEVDGGYQARRRSADARRDRVLERLGYRVMRVEAKWVHEELDVVIQQLRGALKNSC